MKPTYGKFTCVGTVVGTLNNNFYTFKEDDKKQPWRKITCSIKLSDNSFVYVELLGVKNKKINKIFRNKTTGKYVSTERKEVNWVDRYSNLENYELMMPVNVKLSASYEESLLEYDAAELLAENLKDGMKVFIRGNLDFIVHKDKVYDKYVIKELSVIDDRQVRSIGNGQQAYFQQEIVFDSYDEGKLHALIIKKNKDNINKIPFSFNLSENGELINYISSLRKRDVLMVHGDIVYSVLIQDDSIAGLKKELLVTGCSEISHHYSEEDFENQDPFDYVDDEVIDDEFDF
ncbi:hypothetical protein EBB07_28850 [Paenibacillaceae bacterium]|nr:hypothetical protein EBB07_28850 [Paenibacillaceae bacterium]